LTALNEEPAPKPPPLNVKVIEKQQMSEINPGIWDGLTPDQARKYYPQDWERFVKDPYSFRAPRAESYHDLSGMHHCFSAAHGSSLSFMTDSSLGASAYRARTGARRPADHRTRICNTLFIGISHRSPRV